MSKDTNFEITDLYSSEDYENLFAWMPFDTTRMVLDSSKFNSPLQGVVLGGFPNSEEANDDFVTITKMVETSWLSTSELYFTHCVKFPLIKGNNNPQKKILKTSASYLRQELEILQLNKQTDNLLVLWVFGFHVWLNILSSYKEDGYSIVIKDDLGNPVILKNVFTEEVMNKHFIYSLVDEAGETHFTWSVVFTLYPSDFNVKNEISHAILTSGIEEYKKII